MAVIIPKNRVCNALGNGFTNDKSVLLEYVCQSALNFPDDQLTKQSALGLLGRVVREVATTGYISGSVLPHFLKTLDWSVTFGAYNIYNEALEASLVDDKCRKEVIDTVLKLMDRYRTAAPSELDWNKWSVVLQSSTLNSTEHVLNSVIGWLLYFPKPGAWPK